MTQAELDILNVIDAPKKSKKAEKYSRKNKQQKALLQNEKMQTAALNRAKKKAGVTDKDFGNDDYDDYDEPQNLNKYPFSSIFYLILP